MNHKNLLYLFGFLLLVAGCKTEGKRQTQGGYEYELIRKGIKDSIPTGNYVVFNMDLYYKDSLIQSSAQSPQPPLWRKEKKDFGYWTSLLNVIGSMHVNDSFHFYFPIDSFAQKPPGFENFTEPVVYRVGIIRTMDEAVHKLYSDSIQFVRDAEKQLLKDRLPAIEALVKGNIESYKSGGLGSQLQTTPNGLKYIIHEEGTGAKPKPGENVAVHYYGALASDATMFDNSFSRGQPYQFPLASGSVIPGWDEGLLLLNKGAKATFFIPSELAYGAAGREPSIPANAELVFYIELQ